MAHEASAVLPFIIIPLALLTGISLPLGAPIGVGAAVVFAVCLRGRRWPVAFVLLVGLVHGWQLMHAHEYIRAVEGRAGEAVVVVESIRRQSYRTTAQVVIQAVSHRQLGSSGVTAFLDVPDSTAVWDRLRVACEAWRVDERSNLLAVVVPSLDCRTPRIIARQDPLPLILALRRLRHRFIDGLAMVLPSPVAELATGLTLGERTALSPSLVEAFRRSGTTHVLALSGYNVSVLAGVLLAFLPRLLGRRAAALTVAAALAGFLLLTGAPPSLLRATTMAWLFIGAQLLRRRASGPRVLALATTMLLAVQPRLALDLGFLLSVAATAGLLWGAETQGRRDDLRTALRSAARTTIAASAATTPILILALGRLSLVSPLANLVVLPLVPIVFLGSLTLGVIALIAPTVALALQTPLVWCARLFLWFVEQFGSLPFASLEVRVSNVLPFFLPMATVALVWLWRDRPCQRCQCQPTHSTYG